MGQPYVGEIRLFAGNFEINGWAFCNGQLLNIAEYDTLFNLIGTTYGGDGQNTFAVPDLRSRVPVGQGAGPGLTARTIGEKAGTESVALALTQIPNHSHAPKCNTGAGTSASPAGNFWAANANTGVLEYSSTTAGVAGMHAASVGAAGGAQPHSNLMPHLGLNFIISLFGIFPSPN
jgi:microcystin-dependent protein